MKKAITSATLALFVGLGGTVALAAPVQAATGFAFDHRISGADRFSTAVAASKLLYPTDGSAKDVVVVDGYAPVDGLTASYLAGLKSASILYTDPAGTPKDTTDEIARLGAGHVWIVGGTNRVPQAQEDAWEAAGKTVTRIAGADRYATAAMVAKADDSGDAPEQVFIASGTSTADALAVGPIAWARNYPILLTAPDGVPAATSGALTDLGTSTRVVLGSSGSVSDATYTAVGGTSRLGGTNRQQTATAVAGAAITTEHFDTQSVALVRGGDAAAVDALAAAPVAGAHGVPLLFTDFDGTLGADTTGYLQAQKVNYTTAGTGWVFGGQTTVPQATADAATAAVQ